MNETIDSSKLSAEGYQPRTSTLSRALSLSTYFLSGVLSINLSQVLGTPLYLVNQDWYNAWIAYTKQSFGILTMALTQAFAPTTVIVSGDASVRGQLRQSADGSLELKFPDRMVLIANHQIYTDWLYLWWIAYCNGTHGRLYIILKESLKHIPIIGWGMQLSQFIFVKRDWAQDRPQMAQALRKLDRSGEPMWLLLFPEGTNLAPSTRAASARWAAKTAAQDLRHVLLPRSTGLQFCLSELKNSVDYLYDCTIAYEGVQRGEYAQDIFTLEAGYLRGKPPKSVSMYWRRFAIKDIPIHSPAAFQSWINARWREKDLLIENYLRFGRFPADVGSTRSGNGQVLKGSGRLSVPVRPSHWYEFLQIFAPTGVLAMVLYVFYGALPQKVWDSISKETLKTATNDLKVIERSNKGTSHEFNIDALFDRSKQSETFKVIGTNAVRLLQSPEAASVINRAGLVQRWLEDPQKFIVDNLADLSEEKPKRNFLRELQAETEKRQGSNHHGTFWKDLEAAEAKRVNGSSRSSTVSGVVTKRNPPKLGPSVKTTETAKVRTNSFWKDLRTEQSTRSNSISVSSSRAASVSGIAKGTPSTMSIQTSDAEARNCRLKARSEQ